MLHPGVFPLLAADLPQVTIVRVSHVVRAADGRIRSRRTVRRTLALSLVVGHDARRTPSAVGLLAGF